ncbi:DUF4199 domain-containing protein [Fulvivirgaceae bacterium BMA10]|uniref:DUF4199 domain-containing protein n=1 Tax=Splendidivirga corallicola TaxID=3051826 RepID=A0ABT8KJF7_9BACT|nr:DUF4199 domain-containing protein [Fulvivirgaceae bacterium BMA10]
MEQQPTVGKIGFRYGLILSLISIAYFIILNVVGLIANNAFGWLGYIFTIILIVMAHKAFKDQGDGFMSYGQGLGIGTLLSVVSGVISSVFTLIYIKFIDDSMLQAIRDKTIEQLESQGMSDSEIETALEFSSAFTSPTAIAIFGILGALIGGFILSLIISAITKNNNPELEA